MTLLEKIKYLELLLNTCENNFYDSFKIDIKLFFNEDFNENNNTFHFLKFLNTKEDINDWVDTLLAKFVLKFNSEEETEDDFIFFFINK